MLRTREIYPSVFIATAFRSQTGMRVSLQRRNLAVDEVVCLMTTLRCLAGRVAPVKVGEAGVATRPLRAFHGT